MVKNISRILSFNSTNHNKSFVLELTSTYKKDNALCTAYSYETYYADIEQVLDPTQVFYNKGSLIATDANNEKTLYTSLYSLSSFYTKSALYCKNVDTAVPDSRNFQNIYNNRLSNFSDIINQIVVEDTIYQLNWPTIFGKETLISDVYYWHTTNYQSCIPSVKLSTVIFDTETVKLSDVTDINQLSINTTQTNLLSNLQYNQIVEIPGYIYNDYDGGCFAANAYKTKNELDSKYNMKHSEDNALENARQYIRISHCNDQIYLLYYDNTRIKKVNGELSSLDSCWQDLNYQKVEVIAGFNRFEQITKHKTNYYDVDIVCEKMFESLTNIKAGIENKVKNIKQNLKLEIGNMVTDICKQLSPVDTQLIQVNVLEDEFEI